jgi:hypothetical protein
MAGKRHHIVPKFMQKGFASREEGDTAWTWLYHKNIAKPREISITDSIVSEHFYGKGEQSADAAITEFERTKLAPLVNGLRRGNYPVREINQEIAGLVAHLSIRTKLIRKGFEGVSEKFLNGLGGILGDDELLGNAIANQPDSFIKEQFDEVLSCPTTLPGAAEALAAMEELGVSKEEISSVIVGLVREQLNDPESRRQMAEGIGEFFNELFSAPNPLIAESIRDGHVKGLKAAVAPLARVEVFERFEWSIQVCDFDLILGDSATIFESRSHNTLVPFCDLVDITTVLLPISTHQLLIGSEKPGVQMNVTPNINHAIARCSYEQFVGNSNIHIGLIDRIGMEGLPISEAEIDAELNQIRENMKK